MSKIEIVNCVYKVHPVYDLYAANEAGEVMNIVKKDAKKGHNNNGYMMYIVRKHAQKGQKSMYVHRFVWECFNGLIPKDKVIDHVNNIRDDNRLCNLQMMTQQENFNKSAKVRDYTFVAKNHRNKKCVKATNTNTNEVSYYNSLYTVQQHLGINAGIVKMVCENINRCKTGVSKKDSCSYKFEYVNEQDMPDDYNKSANIRPKMSEEDKKKHHKESMKKWYDKEYKCPKCNKVLKNSNRQYHNKKCK